MGDVITLVVGLGQTGFSIARYLTRQQQSFVMFDTREAPPDAEAFRAQWPKVKLYTGTFPLEQVATLDRIIVSPGVPLDIDVLERARFHGISIIGDVECLAREISAPVMAITGTNGKSTVTALCGEMAAAAGIKVAVAGNIGTPVLDMLEHHHDAELWVLELSSFQLDLTYSLAPKAATILNISEDHLDRHGSLEAYRQAKHRIYRHAKHIIANADDEATWPTPEEATYARCIRFSSQQGPHDDDVQWTVRAVEQRWCLYRNEEMFIDVNDMTLKGIHNWQNALAACALAEACGISKQAVIDVLKRFESLPHRCQWVRTISGVDWLNDSKGTNVGATIAAIEGNGPAIRGKIVLIAGGQGKGADFSTLLPSVQRFVRCVVLMGQDTKLIEQSLAGKVSTVHVTDMDDAVKKAAEMATEGDMVLLSPACASLDMFQNYQHRGEVFMKAVNAQ